MRQGRPVPCAARHRVAGAPAPGGAIAEPLRPVGLEGLLHAPSSSCVFLAVAANKRTIQSSNRKTRHLQPRIDSCRPSLSKPRRPERRRDIDCRGKPGAPARRPSATTVVAPGLQSLAAPHDCKHLIQTPGKHEPNEPAAEWSTNLLLSSRLRKACSAEFLLEAAGRARVSGRDAAFAGWQ